jgi:large subunit ribosomal protein L15e
MLFSGKAVMKHRELRGLTAAGRKGRGVGKGHGKHRFMPSRRSVWKKHNSKSFQRYR